MNQSHHFLRLLGLMVSVLVVAGIFLFAIATWNRDLLFPWPESQGLIEVKTVSQAEIVKEEGKHTDAQAIQNIQLEVPPIPTEVPTQPPPNVSTSTQYVLLSFDGSRSLDMWKNTINFAREMKQAGKPIHFTYFVSGVYFIPEAQRFVYHPPKHPAGMSNIGWADSEKDVADRIEIINQAIADGHEIGSHVNGHFDGSTWSKADWLSEMNQFEQFVLHPEKQVPELSSEKSSLRQQLTIDKINGFRAPELGRDDAMYQVLSQNKYSYDASGIRKPEDWPFKDSHGIWHLSLAQIHYGTSTRPILSMDYNFYFMQSAAKDTLKRGTPAWQKMYDDMRASYKTYFDTNYAGSRAPVIIGHHFSTWNDGVYWQVMKDFASDVCGKPDVKCVSMQEFVDVLEGRH